MSHVFISYSKQNIAFMRYLRSLLEAEGIRVWVDEARLHAGTRWWREIEESVKGCNAFVIIMTPDARNSDWVEREILMAEGFKRPIFPVLLSGDPWTRLANIQYEDMRDGLRAKLSSRFIKEMLDVVGTAPQIVEFTIQPGNIFTTEADMIAFKYAQAFYGADDLAAGILGKHGIRPELFTPAPGEHAIVQSPDEIKAMEIIFTGTPSLRRFGYKTVHELMLNTLSGLAQERPSVNHLAMTAHGTNTRLDETRAFISQLNGYLEAIQTVTLPIGLKRITLVERNRKRANRLRDIADELFAEIPEASKSEDEWLYTFKINLSDDELLVKSSPEEIENGTHVVVSIPDTETMEDFFYYGIQSAVHGHGLLCERFDNQQLDSEQWAQIQARITSAVAFIADVTQINPNIALKIGYALGCGCPVMLISQDAIESDLFSEQTRIMYSNIRNLETQIKSTLNTFKERGEI